MREMQSTTRAGLVAICLMVPALLFAQNLPCMSIGTPTGNERAYALVQEASEDLGYVLAGYTDAQLHPNHDVLIVRTDSFGVPSWVRATPPGEPEDYDDEATSMVTDLVDGTYWVTGWTRSQSVVPPAPPGASDIFVAHLDQLGNILARTQVLGIHTGQDDKAFSIVQTVVDPGFIITGWTDYDWPHAGERHIAVWKFDPVGVLQWWSLYDFRYMVEPVPLIDEGYGIIEIPSGGLTRYAVVGRSEAIAPGNFDAFVMGIRADGFPLWGQLIAGEEQDEAYSVEFNQTTGNIAVAGWTNSFALEGATADTNIFVWELDHNGNTQWNNIYGWNSVEEYNEERVMDDKSLVWDPVDNNYVVSGWTPRKGPGAPPNSNFLVFKVDRLSLGAPLWGRVHPSPHDPDILDDRAYPMILDSRTGGFAIAGYNTGFQPGQEDFHLLTIDKNGDRPVCVIDEPPLFRDIPHQPQMPEYFEEGYVWGPFTLIDFYVEHKEVCGLTRDVGRPTTSWLFPTGTIYNGATVTPACSVYNYGNTTENYWVEMKIGSFYEESTQVTGHASGATEYVTFTGWNATQLGTHTVACSTRLAFDVDQTNDRWTNRVTVVDNKDVGCTKIEAPTGSINHGTTVTPACSVYNYGATNESYNVRMKIGSFYDHTAPVTGHAPGTYKYVTFPDWNATQTGFSHPVTCSTELTGDVQPGNDKCSGTVSVLRPNTKDVGCHLIVAPAGCIDQGTVVTPACSVYNYGNTTESYNVRMRIGTFYDHTAPVTNHLPGTVQYINTFTNWTASNPKGTYPVECETELSGDMQPANDKKTGWVVIRFDADVGVSSLLTPVGTATPGSPITPACLVYNYGANSQSGYQVRMKIGSAYDQTATVTGPHAPNTNEYLTFPVWTPSAGSYVVSCSTELTGDEQPSNDKKTGVVRVRHQWPSGWTEVESMPSGLLGKPVKRGAWLAYCAANGLIYAAKGNKTTDFYSYDPAANSWTQLTGMPYQTHSNPKWARKIPRKGSKGVCDGDQYIYVTQGNNTLGYWRYDIGANTWTEMSDVPLGGFRKKVKGGTDMAYVPANTDSDSDYVYLLKGYKTEFYRFNVPGQFWDTSLVEAPSGPRGKWDKGSWVGFNPQPEPPAEPFLVAHMAKYHDGTNHHMYKYDLSTGTWGPNIKGMPLEGLHSGRLKNKKSKDGGCAAFGDDRTFYAIKGGNTQQFFSCAIIQNGMDGDSTCWAELDTIPVYGSAGRKRRVKHGADIAYVGDSAFFALKGNKTRELWRYVHTGPRATGSNAGVMAESGKRSAVCGLRITPNPLADGFVTLRYTLPKAGPAIITVFDVAGRSVKRVRVTPCAAQGCHPMDLRDLSAGVYLVQLDADGFTATRKLVVKQ